MSETARRIRPWFAVLVAFFLPSAAMAYLNRGGWALVYFAGILAIAFVGFLLLPVMASTALPEGFVQYSASCLTLAGMVHAFVLARRKITNGPLKWYSRRWYLVAASYYAFFAVLLVIRAFLYQTFNVPSEGMVPTVDRGDFFIASKAAYNSSAPARGDIILFHPASFPKTTYFKRVIGLPGEKIQMKGGVIFINDRPVQQSAGTCASQPCAGNQYREHLSPGHDYEVRILNRASELENTDPRFIPQNSYFVLGDNRDNSDDSRLEVGYVSASQIIGRAAFKYISGGHYVWQVIS